MAVCDITPTTSTERTQSALYVIGRRDTAIEECVELKRITDGHSGSKTTFSWIWAAYTILFGIYSILKENRDGVHKIFTFCCFLFECSFHKQFFYFSVLSFSFGRCRVSCSPAAQLHSCTQSKHIHNTILREKIHKCCTVLLRCGTSQCRAKVQSSLRHMWSLEAELKKRIQVLCRMSNVECVYLFILCGNGRMKRRRGRLNDSDAAFEPIQTSTQIKHLDKKFIGWPRTPFPYCKSQWANICECLCHAHWLPGMICVAGTWDFPKMCSFQHSIRTVNPDTIEMEMEILCVRPFFFLVVVAVAKMQFRISSAVARLVRYTYAQRLA